MSNSVRQWTSLLLSEIAEIERTAVSPENIKSGTLYVGLENITSSGTFVGVSEVASGDLASTKFAFTDKHILYGKLRPYLAKIACPQFSGVCSTDILPILPGPKVDRRFLLHFLRQPRMVDFASSQTAGANLPRLSPKALAEFEIPLPPLSEQKRIADILDKADAIRRKRQEALKEFQCLQNSVFFEMFGDPRKNPFALPTTPLKELLKLKSGDFLPQREMHMDGPHAVYGGNGISGRHSKFMFDQPKIVIGRVGAYCGAVHITEPKSWITDNALYVAEKDDGLTELYLAEALRLAHLNQYASQSGQPLISGSRIYPVEIMVPPFEQQIQFARIATHLKLAESKLTTTESETTNLFNCLIQFAFKGEL